MLLHSDPLFSIYCGDKKDSFPRHHFYSVPDSKALLASNQFATACRLLNLEDLLVIKQVHSDKGFVISNPKHLDIFKPYQHEGDYLVTNLMHVGLAIASADCLPIIAYDNRHNAIGIAHTGWAGSLKSVAIKMIQSFEDSFGTKVEDVRIFMGPSAKVCCYEIKHDVEEQVLQFAYGKLTLEKRDGKVFFNVPLFNQLQLEDYGFNKSAFNTNYSLCTVCNPAFCSHRRDGDLAQRQVTIVALK